MEDKKLINANDKAKVEEAKKPEVKERATRRRARTKQEKLDEVAAKIQMHEDNIKKLVEKKSQLDKAITYHRNNIDKLKAKQKEVAESKEVLSKRTQKALIVEKMAKGEKPTQEELDFLAKY